MKNKTQVSVVMLATDKSSSLFKDKYGKLWYGGQPQVDELENQHLYFVSDEEIKEGDWFIHITFNKVNQLTNELIAMEEDINVHRAAFKKIVATTNPELWRFEVVVLYKKKAAYGGVYKIPEDFVKLYAEKQGKIDKVWLETEDIKHPNSQNERDEIIGVPDSIKILKLNPDGSVMWSLGKSNFGGYYILNGKEPVPVDDVIEWAVCFETEKRIVRQDHLPNGIMVSTMFMGLDRSFSGEKPLLFETMIFGGKHDEYQERYSTWDEAEEGHGRAVRMNWSVWKKIGAFIRERLGKIKK